VSKYWTELVNRLTPYVPGEQRVGANIIKLNTNENPYPPSPQVQTAIANVAGDALRRYPDPNATALCNALAEYHGLASDQVFVGNGSDEILALSFMAFFTGGKPLQYPSISYSFYPVYCDLLAIPQQTIPLNDDFSLNTAGFDNDCCAVIFPNPNAPTARSVALPEIRALLERLPDKVVLIDEAYADFGDQSAVGLINEYPNLLISQTFSKGRSLAGLRLGVALGNSDLIEGLRRVKDSFNSYPVDAVAQAAGIASLADQTYFEQTTNKIIATREQSISALQSRGFNVLPSDANFVFVSHQSKDAAQLFEDLDRTGILVRYWPKPALADWLRISIGTDDEMTALLNAIDTSLSSA